MSAPSSDGAQPQLTGEALKQAIKKQVEFYFSRANLANDAFLVSHMNSQMFVPVDVIITFAKVKQLTEDTQLLVDSIQGSSVCSLNETKDAIKPNIKSERNTIILREIPSATQPDEVKAIFDGCGEVVNVRSDVGDTWFVTMASEDEAVSTLLALRSKKFNDAPIKARLKSENLLKSFYPTQPAAPENATAAMTTPYGARGYYNAPQMGYYDAPNANANAYGMPYNARGGQYGTENSRYGMNQRGGRGGRHSSRGGHASSQVHAGKDARHKAGADQRPNGKKGKEKRGAPKQSSAASPAAATGGKKAPASAERQPILNSANFPPLPTTPEDEEPQTCDAITHVYSHEDIMEIVKNMDENDCTLPAGKMDFEKHAAALTPVAHPDLLRNQRTYSIEQAREAMRQGRPIRSDSVGSIDYESLMYGEDYTKEARELRKQQQAEAAAPKTEEAKTVPPPPPVKTASKFAGYAAAVIHGSPASPTVANGADAKKPVKAKTPKDKEGKKKAKESPVKAPENKEAASATKAAADLPKAGAWGGRNFLDVVKSEPTAVAAATAPASSTPSTSGPAKTVEKPKEK